MATIQLLAVPGHYLGQEHDDAQYVLTALSLLRGRLSLGILPGDPALTFNTPGWPLLLAPAAAVSGDSPSGYELWSWAWLVACDALFWLWLRRRAGPGACAAATALFALNPLILSRSGVAMTELPFLAFALLTLLLLDPSNGRGTVASLGRAPGWALGALLGWCWLIRPAALPLFPAVGLELARRRRWRELCACALVAAAPILLWKAWVGAHGDRLAEVSELSLMWSGRSLAEVFRYAAANLAQAAALWGATSLPWPPAPDYSGSAFLLGAALSLAALAGAVRWTARKGYEPAAAFLGFGALMQAFWPYWYERYLVPYLPFLVWSLWACLDGLKPRSRAPAAVLAILAVLSLGQGRLLLGGEDRSKPELARTYAWIRSATPPGALFASAFYCRDAFYSGRPFISLPGEGPLAQALARRRVRYVLWQELPDLGSSLGERFPWTKVLRGLKAQLERPPFGKIHEEAAERASVYAVP